MCKSLLIAVLALFAYVNTRAWTGSSDSLYSSYPLRNEIRQSLLQRRHPNLKRFLSGPNTQNKGNTSHRGAMNDIEIEGRDSVAVAWIAENIGYGNAITVDTASNVFIVAGSGSFTTIMYDSTGTQQWLDQYRSGEKGNDIAVGPSGNVYVTGFGLNGSDYQYVTIKYSPEGAMQWVSNHSSGDLARVLALDPLGGICITGLAGSDYLTVRYGSDGALLWEARYDGGLSESPFAIVVDLSGNVYVTGYAEQPGGTFAEYATVKYGPGGDQRWVSSYQGQIGGWNAATSIAVNDEGAVFVTGESSIDYEYDFATIKYDSSGTEEWATRYDGGGNDLRPVMAVGQSGDLYVAGSSGYTLSEDYVTIKFDSSGVRNWVARYGRLQNASDLVMAIAADEEGNVYVTGASEGSMTEYDFATVKYDRLGNPQWVARYGLAEGSYDFATDIALDAEGNVLVTGSSILDGDIYSTTIKYVQFPYSCGSNQVAAIEPAHESLITSDSVSLIWSRAFSQMNRYWLEADTDSLFSTPFIDSLLMDTVYTLHPLEHDRVFWWRVRARSSQGWGRFSEARNFFVFQSIPPPPAPVSPSNDAVGVPVDLVFIWAPAPGAESYTLQLSDAVDFSMLIVDADSTSGVSFDMSGLSNDVTYYWRVSAINALGTSEWSEVWTFTAGTVTAVDVSGVTPTVLTLSQNYPNPFNPSTTITYGLPERTHVRLRIFDALGQQITVLVDGEREAGWHEIQMGNHELASGIYFYRIEAGRSIITKKLLLVR